MEIDTTSNTPPSKTVINKGLLASGVWAAIGLALLSSCGNSVAATQSGELSTPPDTTASAMPALEDSESPPTQSFSENQDADIENTSQSAVNTNNAVSPSSSTGILDAQWGDNVTLTVNGDTLNITSDGVPNYDYPDQWAAPGDPINISADNAFVVGDVVSEQNYDYDFPLDPVYSESTTDTPMGLIGIAISGAAIFNPYEAGGSYAIEANFDIDGIAFIDSCSGHPEGNGAYHYHAVPHCITDAIDVDGEHSAILGIALDGFAIYGDQGVNGEAPTDLDECSGHFEITSDSSKMTYHYHMSDSAPYSIDCFHGEYDASQTTSQLGGPAGGPSSSDRPQGPPPGQGR